MVGMKDFEREFLKLCYGKLHENSNGESIDKRRAREILARKIRFNKTLERMLFKSLDSNGLIENKREKIIFLKAFV